MDHGRSAKLRLYSDMLAACIDRVTIALGAENPAMGRNIAIDGSDMPAYANGQRSLSKNRPERERYSDPDASWGHRSAVSTRKGGGFYGYKIDMAVCTATDLPLAWNVRAASEAETSFALPLIDKARERGFAAFTCALDKGYDNGPIHDGCEDRDVRPIIPLRKTPSVARGETSRRPVSTALGSSPGPTTAQGDQVALPDPRVQARVPVDQGRPAAPADPAQLQPLGDLYRGRGAVEREFGRLKNDWALAPLRVRGLDRVRLHPDLTILAKLATALARARAVPLAA